MTETNTGNEMQRLVYSMMTESTGAALCDSGGAYGRHWERNQKLSLADFIASPQVTFELYGDDDKTADEMPLPTVSVFHYMSDYLKQDELTRLVNNFMAENGDDLDDLEPYLEELGLCFEKDQHGWNTYNGECNLSQTLQGHNVHRVENSSNFEYPEYVLISVHNGCDVRGGYTDFKMFRVVEYFTGNPNVYTSLENKNLPDEKQTQLTETDDLEYFELSNDYDGYSMTGENGENAPDWLIKQYTNKELCEALQKNAGTGY